ncbi:MAG: endonuclease I family protein [Bacilli bacterium]|jgi:endonuclease I
MKKSLSFLTLLILVLTLSSCGKPKASEVSSDSEISSTTSISADSSFSSEEESSSEESSSEESSSEAITSSEPLAVTYTFTLTIEGLGQVIGSPSGSYPENTKIELSATADEGHKFQGFYEGDVLQSWPRDYQFSLVKDTVLVAKFVDQASINYVPQVFAHKFLHGNFSGTGYDTSPGKKLINGLTWSYDAFTYLGQSSDGIQVGSQKQPQKTPWTLSTNFQEEVVITSIAYGGKNPVPVQLEITGTDFTFSETITNSTYEMFNFDDLEYRTSTFTLSLCTSGNRAFYFDYLKIACLVDEASPLQLKTDCDTVSPAVPGQNGVPVTAYALTTKEEYYAGVNLELTETALLNELNAKISVMTMYSYGTDTNIMLYTDAKVEDGRYLYGIYDGDDIAATNSGVWNKEHVWACSMMGLGGSSRPSSSTKNKSSDLHNLRVSCQNSNGAHGNKFFDETNTAITFFPNISGTPNAAHNYAGDHRGDVARILFYMATRYLELHLNDELDVADEMSMGKLSTLLEWNTLDPVDAFEIQRNNRIFEYQGNRNPFIDYPELATAIWG